MHSICDIVRIHAHLLPTGAFWALDTLLHPNAFAHTKGPHIRAPHATTYKGTCHVWHCQHTYFVCTAIDIVDARSLNDVHITSTMIDSRIGVAERLHYYVKEQHTCYASMMHGPLVCSVFECTCAAHKWKFSFPGFSRVHSMTP